MLDTDPKTQTLWFDGASRPLSGLLAALRRRLNRLSISQRVILGLVLYALVWLGELSLTRLSAPMDDIEQLTWVRSLEWGYYKHPPLPTWLLWLPVKLFGLNATTVSVFGAAITLGTFWLLWHLLRRMRGERFASVALLGVLCITFYNGRLDYYNHNIVLMLASTLAAAATWQAFASRQLRWWIAVGFALGFGALAKYQIALTVLSMLALWLQQRAWRDALHRLGLLLAMLIALLLFLPHLQWLRTHGFAPVDYAMQSSLGVHREPLARLVWSLRWLCDQLFNRALPAWLLLAAVWRAPRIGAPSAAVPRTGVNLPPTRALLVCWGMLPLLAMTLMGLAEGTDLQLHWGTPFLLFTVPAVMECWPGAWQQAPRRRLAGVFAALQGLLLALNVSTSVYGPQAWRTPSWRNFDSPLLAERVGNPARRQLGGTIHYIVGPTGDAGALALMLAERPLVLIDGRFDRSPWVQREILQRCGALQLGTSTTLPEGRAAGAEFPGLRWQVLPGSADLCSSSGKRGR